ncbi:hypothetical protein A2U01_0067173, partial [Trifolium medium]|nr:hypothetical protein [Trifolium medium]
MIKRDMIQCTVTTSYRPPFFDAPYSIKVTANTHPRPPQRLNPHRKRVPQLLLHPQ